VVGARKLIEAVRPVTVGLASFALFVASSAQATTINAIADE
jgi:hypothetical protein